MRREVGGREGRVMGMYCVCVCGTDSEEQKQADVSDSVAPNVRTNNVSQVKELMKRYIFFFIALTS